VTFDTLLNEFALRIGIPELSTDASDVILEIEDLQVAIRHDASYGRVALVADVGGFPRERQGEIAAKLVELNLVGALSGGHSCAASAETERCLCCVSIPLQGLDCERLDREVALLVRKSKAVKELLAAEADAAAALGRELVAAEPEDHVLRA
jgi:hypothetical protein